MAEDIHSQAISCCGFVLLHAHKRLPTTRGLAPLLHLTFILTSVVHQHSAAMQNMILVWHFCPTVCPCVFLSVCHTDCVILIRQEALLLQRDRATRYVSKFVRRFTRNLELERFETAQVTLNVIQGHLQRCHSIGHIRFPISVSVVTMSLPCTVNEILSLISQNLKRSRDTSNIPFWSNISCMR